MSASAEYERTVQEDDETLRALNRIGFDIRDEVFSALEQDNPETGGVNDKHDYWMNKVESAKRDLEDIRRTSQADEMVEEARSVIQEKVIEPYKENIAGEGPYIPGFSAEPPIENQEQAMKASAELEDTYLQEVIGEYESILRISATSDSIDYSEVSGR